jgi:hypothetical protein
VLAMDLHSFPGCRHRHGLYMTVGPSHHQFHEVGFMRTYAPEDLPAHEFQRPSNVSPGCSQPPSLQIGNIGTNSHFLQPYSAGTFKLLFSVVNLWRDGVGGGVPFATGGSFECRQQRSALVVALRAGDGPALLPWVSSPARSVHDRWPFAPSVPRSRFSENLRS